jgi:hypothetical protein
MLIPARMPQHATLSTTHESYDCVRPLEKLKVAA